jgi:hypothetical protein
MSEEKAITLYLAGWQKRMVKDYLKSAEQIKDHNKIKINKLEGQNVRPYMALDPDSVKNNEWSLYLTDEQINYVTGVLGIKTQISALNISQEMLKSGAIVFE